MSTNITPQKNRKSNIRNPRKFKIRDTFSTDLVDGLPGGNTMVLLVNNPYGDDESFN